MAYNAKAIGSGSEGAQNELEREYHRVSKFIIYHTYILILKMRKTILIIINLSF